MSPSLNQRIVSVIIPFFQRERGILGRALNSIMVQHIPEGWVVDVIVIDDGSPCQAYHDVSDLYIEEPFHLRVIRQHNGGVAAARNRGLEEAGENTTLIAFLDSDDTWPINHISRVVDAIENGFDFYFTDNRRTPYHNSYIAQCAPNTERFLALHPQKTGVIEIPTSHMVGLIIKEFPTQASTVAYKRDLAVDLRFDTTLSSAGEDVLFFATLAASARRIGFDLDNCVECGNGVNMYFGNFGWDSPKCLAIRTDQVRAHRLIAKISSLSSESKRIADTAVLEYRKDLGFHVMRNLVKFPTRVPKEIIRLARLDPWAAIILPADIVRALVYSIFTAFARKHIYRVE